MKIRAMRADDWECVRTIYQQSLDRGTAFFTRESPSWEEWDRGHHRHSRWVCEYNGAVVGFAVLKPYAKAAHYSGVASVSIYVDEAYHRRGIGKGLLEKLCQSAQEQGLWLLTSHIFAQNAASIELHKACGFRIAGTRERIARNIFGQWQSTVIMDKNIGEE